MNNKEHAQRQERVNESKKKWRLQNRANVCEIGNTRGYDSKSWLQRFWHIVKDLISQHAFIMWWGWDPSPTVQIPLLSDASTGQDIVFKLKMVLKKVCFYGAEVKHYQSYIKVCKAENCCICFERPQIRARNEFWSVFRKWKMSLLSVSQSLFLFVLLIFVPFLKVLHCWLCPILPKTLIQNRSALVLFNFRCPESVVLCKHLNRALYFLAFFLCSASRFFVLTSI